VKQIRTVQVGLGLIGGAVIEQIVAHRADWRKQGIDVGVSALVATTGAVTAKEAGFSDDQLRSFTAARAKGADLSRIARDLGVAYTETASFDIGALGLDRPIVMDAAAGSATSALVRQALGRRRVGRLFKQGAALAGQGGSRCGRTLERGMGRPSAVRDDLWRRSAGHFHDQIAPGYRRSCNVDHRLPVGHTRRYLLGYCYGQVVFGRH
jgi:hypothetical protein